MKYNPKSGFQKGYKMTESHRKNLSKSLKGKKAWNKGLEMSESYKKKLSEVHTKDFSEIQIMAKHHRMENKYGKPKFCEICKHSDKKKYEWANINHKYNQDIKEWKRLCVSCHRKYDIEHNNYRNFKKI